MTTQTGNWIVEGIFLLTFLAGLLWPSRHH